MSGNSRANQWSGNGKKQSKEAVAQEQLNAEALGGLRQMVFQMYQSLVGVESRLDRVQGTARAADYRARALERLLANDQISKETVGATIVTLQEEDFEQNSALDDAQKNLENATGPATNGLTAITTIRMFKNGKELTDERVVRSKIVLGEGKIFRPEFDNEIIGMNVGQARIVADPLGNGSIDEAEITLLGLRQVKAAPTTGASQEDKSQES